MRRPRTHSARWLAAATAAVAACAFTMAASADDNQAWLKFSAECSPFENGLYLSVEERLKFDSVRFLDEETLMLVGYRFSPYFKAAIGHRIVRERRPDERHLLSEQRQTTDLCFAAPEFWMLKFDFRSRFELCDKHNAQAYMRYRERFRLRTSWSVTDFRISPYVSNEVFLSDRPKSGDSDLFNRNRAEIGLSFRPIPSLDSLSCNLYFMVQHDKDTSTSSWSATNVYGLDIAFSF